MSGDITVPPTYQPTMQGAADSRWNSLLSGMNADILSSTTPGQVFSPYAQQAGMGVVNNPYTGQMQTGANEASVASGTLANTLLPQVPALAGTASALMGDANQVMNTAFDPQQRLFNQTQGQVLNQSNVANSMAGLGSSPYGASQTANTLGNFDMNWQNNQLNRQATGLGAASGAVGQAANTLGQAGTLGNSMINQFATGQALPYNTANVPYTNDLSAISSAIGAGNQKYVLPEQLLNNLQSYLQLGQSGSSIGSGVNAQNLSNIGNVGSGLGNLVGGNGMMSSLMSMVGSA